MASHVVSGNRCFWRPGYPAPSPTASRSPLSHKRERAEVTVGLVFAFLLMPAAAGLVRAAAPASGPPLTSVTVFVTDAVTHKAVFQAHLTLRFQEPQSRRHKMDSYSAKTDLHGRYTFTFIPMEPVVLIVTDPNHRTFGRQFQITQANQEIRVTLLRPQPLR